MNNYEYILYTHRWNTWDNDPVLILFGAAAHPIQCPPPQYQVLIMWCSHHYLQHRCAPLHLSPIRVTILPWEMGSNHIVLHPVWSQCLMKTAIPLTLIQISPSPQVHETLLDTCDPHPFFTGIIPHQDYCTQVSFAPAAMVSGSRNLPQ